MPIKNKDEYNLYMKEYMIKRYHKRRQEIIDQLGGKCSGCGSFDNLEIHHKNRNEKSFPIGEKLHTMNKNELAQEIIKCILLCKNCHNIQTLKDLDRTRTIDENGNILIHGTISSYKHCKCDICRKIHSDYCKKYNQTHVRLRDRNKS